MGLPLPLTLLPPDMSCNGSSRVLLLLRLFEPTGGEDDSGPVKFKEPDSAGGEGGSAEGGCGWVGLVLLPSELLLVRKSWMASKSFDIR